jgi:hypothetical protein
MTRQPALAFERAIEFGGTTVQVNTDSEKIATWFEFDFGTFITTGNTSSRAIKISVTIADPCEYKLPALKESMRGPHFVTFDEGTTRYIKYGKEALLIYDYARDEGQIIAIDEDIAYERLHLACLSRIGERLDEQGMHRVHALAIAFKDRAHLFLMPPGTGKSTLGIELLSNHADIRLISDDTPVISQSGDILPFLFRLGIENSNAVEAIPSRFKREASFGNKHKTLIDVRYFEEQTQRVPVKPKSLFIGFWTTSNNPQLIKAGWFTAMMFLFRDCVVGCGIPQVAEIFLRKEDIAKKIGYAFSRLGAIIRVAGRCKCYKLFLCNDPKKNAELVYQIMSQDKQSTS